jgi:hypothetical protein
MKSMADIDRIHESVMTKQGRHISPHSRVEAYMYLMLGEVWGGDIGNQYLCLGCRSGADNQSLFVELMQDYEVEFTIHNNVVYAGGKAFWFYDNHANIEDVGSGYIKFDRIFYATGYSIRRYNILNDTLLTTTVLAEDGDIV